MSECIYCANQGYWECDGEGGECPPDVVPPVHPPCPKGPDTPHWKIRYGYDNQKPMVLKYRNGQPVKGQDHKPVTIKVDATVEPLRVEVNGHDVGHGKENGGTQVPYPGDPRNRVWQIDKVWTLKEENGSDVVKDEDGNDVRVRVEAYAYTRDACHGSGHKEGRGPKVRLYAES